MGKKFRFVLAVALVLLLMAPPAFAGLAAVGPVNPNNGFPQWYKDTNGASAWLTTPPFGNLVTPPTMIYLVPDLANTFSVQIGFDQEAFYYICRADTKSLTSPLGKVLYQMGLEAGFANLVTTNGQQAVFSRLRVTFPGVKTAGTYTVRHPWGTESIVVTASDITNKRGLKFTRDIPIASPLNFTGALTGDVGPFVKQNAPAPAITIGTPAPFNTQWQTDPLGKGWLGDGVTPATIVGSPVGFNQVTITGPTGSDIGGVGINTIGTNLFVVAAWDNPAALTATSLTVPRVSYARTSLGTNVDVFAVSTLGATLNIFSPSTSTTAIVPSMTAGTGLLAGMFFEEYPSAGPPAAVKVTATAVGAAPTSLIVNCTDVVIITAATWSKSTQHLVITASSSDKVLLPPLSVTSPPLGAIPAAGTLDIGCAIPPATVTVNSTKGGSCTELVQIIP